ncbi:ATP-dependent helicase 1 [Cucumis melo var. makuwa]|uniref:ATP-dependent helicase 1 n=1 Tax=Cucumis melo var. makuwa TaxID=1194695 RepID=A0A5D3E754_CUCMM|nr:ATP-dependent helicase 1 [Cucumis melo var. makuwa]
MGFEGRHKFGYLTGEISRPRPGDPQEHIWKGEDSPLRSLLINSMEPQIENHCCMLQLLEISGMQFISYIPKAECVSSQNFA